MIANFVQLRWFRSRTPLLTTDVSKVLHARSPSKIQWMFFDLSKGKVCDYYCVYCRCCIFPMGEIWRLHIKSRKGERRSRNWLAALSPSRLGIPRSRYLLWSRSLSHDRPMTNPWQRIRDPGATETLAQRWSFQIAYCRINTSLHVAIISQLVYFGLRSSVGRHTYTSTWHATGSDSVTKIDELLYEIDPRSIPSIHKAVWGC